MQESSKKLGYAEGIASVVINTLLFGLKIWVGKASSSVAMTADAWHTLSDTLTSIVVIFGFWISSRPEDEEHPFGHGRAEVIATIIIATLLAVVGINFLKDSIQQLIVQRSASFSTVGLVVFAISVVVKEGLARFSIWAGKKTNSQSLLADGWHHRSDALASLIIVIGAILGKYLWWVDGVLGIGVSALILYAAYDIARVASNSLMGEKTGDDLTKRIKKIATEASPELKDIHHIHVHRYGDHLEITLHARLDKKTDIEDAHELSTKLEQKLRNELKADTTVHIEPVKEA
ncbi:MAG: Ferrous-iron efflux pump FieF [Spirochaetes bacterium ADurb.Bin110]|nr:MAG: Ferrous-iron efflux pump FieF [Spirochaetes bacterium ADurb.Bin110]